MKRTPEQDSYPCESCGAEMIVTKNGTSDATPALVCENCGYYEWLE